MASNVLTADQIWDFSNNAPLIKTREELVAVCREIFRYIPQWVLFTGLNRHKWGKETINAEHASWLIELIPTQTSPMIS